MEEVVEDGCFTESMSFLVAGCQSHFVILCNPHLATCQRS
jgi:hypothetical protein